MALVKLSGNRTAAPRGHIFVESDLIVRIASMRRNDGIRVRLSIPGPNKLHVMTPLAELLKIMGPHIEVQLLEPGAGDEDISYIRRDRIAYVLPTATEDNRLRLKLTNGEDIDVAYAGEIASLLGEATIAG